MSTKTNKTAKITEAQIVKLAAQNRRAEWEIVSRWLRRNKRVTVLKTDVKSFCSFKK